MRSIITGALLAFAFSAHAQDKWNGPDKPKHVAVSFASGFIAEGVLHDRMPVWGRFAVGMAPGLLKEIGDPVFSFKDLTADALGVYLGMQGSGWVIRRNSIAYKTEF